MAASTILGEAMAAPVERTSGGLRKMLFEEIDALRRGMSNPARANALSKMAAGVVDLAKLDIEAAKFLQTHRQPDAREVLLRPLQLAEPLSSAS